MSTDNDEKIRLCAIEAFMDDIDRPQVPEQYDWCPDYQQTEEEVFGKVLQFPIRRRLVEYRRKLKEENEEEEAVAWFATRKITLGENLKEEELRKAKLLLYTWKDAFATELEDMPVTDLVEHIIPVYPGVQPK